MKKLILLMALITVIVCGCSTAAETAEEDYVVKINDEAVSREEFNIYLYETQRSFEALGGEDIWETDFDGRTAEAVAKENTMSTITLVKLANQRAVKSGVTLSDEEKEDAELEAKAIYDSLTDEERAKIGADEELYKAVLLENAVYNRIYDETVKNYVVNDSAFSEYYNTYRETLIEQYKENVSSDEPINEDSLKEYSRANFEDYRKQAYFTKEYEKWESTANIVRNDSLWNEITIIK